MTQPPETFLLRHAARLDHPIDLSSFEEIGRGRTRAVFWSESRPEIVVKVGIKPGYLPRLIWRETRGRSNLGGPVPKMHGYTHVAGRLAQVCQSVLGMDGRPALTLSDHHIGKGIDEACLAQMNDLVEDLLRHRVPVRELKAANVALGRAGGQGPVRLWLIDGVGERALLPVRRFLPFAETLHTLRRAPELCKSMPNVDWDARSRSYVRRKVTD